MITFLTGLESENKTRLFVERVKESADKGRRVAVIVPELKSVQKESEPVLLTDPADQPRSILSRIVHPSVKTLRAAFLHDKVRIRFQCIRDAAPKFFQ